MFDRGLAIAAIEVALKRHAGFLARDYNPVMGIAPGTPIGRDLRGVTTVIAVGGIFAHSSAADSFSLVREAMKNRQISLLPEHYKLLFDTSYLLYGIGVLSQHTPQRALRFAKAYFNFSSTSTLTPEKRGIDSFT